MHQGKLHCRQGDNYDSTVIRNIDQSNQQNSIQISSFAESLISNADRNNNDRNKFNTTTTVNNNISAQNTRMSSGPTKIMTWKKYLAFLIIIFLFLVFAIWEVVTYIHLKVEIKDLEIKLNLAEYRLDDLKNDQQGKYKNPPLFLDGAKDVEIKQKNPFVAINLCGDGNQRIRSRRGQPYTEWKQTMKSGDIEYDPKNGNVVIKTPGIYYIYAQMYTYQNQNTKSDTLEFHIKREYDILALASVPKTSCLSYCSRYVSRMISLNKGDRIYVTSYENNVQFYMSCDKALFGMYMLKKQ